VLAVFLLEFSTGAEELLHDSREGVRIGEGSESVARDVVDHDLVAGMGRLPGPHDLVSFGQDRFAGGRPSEGVRMALVERHDFEEAFEEDRPAHATQDRHANTIKGGIEGRIHLKRLSVDANLVQGEFRRETAEWRHVPMPQRLDGECRRNVARQGGLPEHERATRLGVFLVIAPRIPGENPL